MKSYVRRARLALAQYEKEHPVLSGAVKIEDYRPPPGRYVPAPRPVRYEPQDPHMPADFPSMR